MFEDDLVTNKFIKLKIIKQMSNKSKFLKSATLAIAGLVLSSGLASCKMMHEHKGDYAAKEPSVKEEKIKSSSKTKEAKVAKTKVAKTEKAKAVTKKAE